MTYGPKPIPWPLRFWPKVNKYGAFSLYRCDLGPCWIWTASTNIVSGYGQFKPSGRGMRATHPIAYEALVGPVPEGMELDHLCRVRACVNPAHLEPVPHRENLRRSPYMSRPYCKHGHEYTPENTRYKRSDGSRECVTCTRERARARYHRMKAAS